MLSVQGTLHQFPEAEEVPIHTCPKEDGRQYETMRDGQGSLLLQIEVQRPTHRGNEMARICCRRYDTRYTNRLLLCATSDEHVSHLRFRIPLLITVGRRVGLKYSRRGRLILPLYSSCPPYFAAPLGRDLGDDANHSPANSCFSNIIPTSFTFNLPSAGTYMCNVSLPRAFGLFFFHEV